MLISKEGTQKKETERGILAINKTPNHRDDITIKKYNGTTDSANKNNEKT